MGKLPRIKSVLEMRRAPLEYFCKLSQSSAKVVSVKLGFETVSLINHPDAVAHIFRTNQKNYIRSRIYKRLAPLMGQNLFTTEGAEWQRQRQNSQPSMSGPNLKKMISQMKLGTDAAISTLQGHAETRENFSAFRFAAMTTLDIALRSFFSVTLDEKMANRIYENLSTIVETWERRIWAIFPTPVSIPTPQNIRFRAAVHDLRSFTGEMVAERLKLAEQPNDLLGNLIEAEKKQSKPDLIFDLLVDQCVFILLASHETGAETLTWFLCMMSRFPSVGRKIAAEADRVLNSGVVDFKSVTDLTYTAQVCDEILRLYPPAWNISRQAVADDEICGHTIPAGRIVMVSPYVIHRLKEFWPNPEGFEPDRFQTENKKRQHSFAFFPFAGGKNNCLGYRFAKLESVLLFASLMQKFEFHLQPGQDLRPVPMTTLRPASEMIMEVVARSTRQSRNIAA